MKMDFGEDALTSKSTNPQRVIWDSKQVVNPHLLMFGVSGSGKTYNIRKMCKELVNTGDINNLRIHVFDVHGDIELDDTISSSVIFSESTQWGLNPLHVNPDPHFGGVRKKIQGFVNTINKVMRSLGTKQEATLRNLLTDLYTRHGFDINNPNSWIVADTAEPLTNGDPARQYLDVPFAEKDMARSLGAMWDKDVSAWWINTASYTGAITKWGPKYKGRTNPTVADLLRFTRLILEQSYLGTGSEAVANLEIVNKSAQKLFAKTLEAMKRNNAASESAEQADSDLDKAKNKALQSYEAYLNTITTGRELETVMKYDSIDVLKSVLDRIENLNAIGIFKNQKPPLNPEKPIWRYNIKSLLKEEKKLFVLFKLEELFNNAIQRGEQDEILDVVILDEAHIFRDNSDDSIIDTVVKEARKFGLALFCVSQSPTHFSADFLSQTGTKVILGLDETQFKTAENKLMVPDGAIKWLKPQKTMLVNCKRKGNHGDSKPWQWTIIK